MKQVILARNPMRRNFGDTTTAQYLSLRGGPFPVSSIFGTDPHPAIQGSSPWSVPGTFSSLRAEFIVPAYFPFACAWGDSTMEFYHNDAASGLKASIAAAGPSTPGTELTSVGTDISTIVTVAAGDDVGHVIKGGSNSVLNGRSIDLAYSLTFTPTNAGESGYCGCGFNLINPHTSAIYGAPLNGQYAPFGYSDVAQHSILPLDGALFRLDVRLSVAPGAGQSQSFLFLLNGVVQDGSGGTVNTALTVSDAATTGAATFTLPLARTDTLSLRSVSSAGAAATNYTYSVGLRAAIDGQYALCCDTANASPNFTQAVGTPDYANVNEYDGWSQSTAIAVTPPGPPIPEAGMQVPGGLDGFLVLDGMIVEVDTVPLGGSYVFTTRKSLASPLGTPTVTMGPSDLLVQTNLGTVSYLSPTDTLDLQCVSSGSPSNVHTGWTWLLATPTTPPPPVGTPTIMRWLRRFALQNVGNLMQFLSRLEVLMQPGVGLSIGQGSDPIVMLQISRDAGQTWGQELQLHIGKQGEHDFRAYINRLGRARSFYIELTGTDPVPMVLLDCLVDLEVGSS